MKIEVFTLKAANFPLIKTEILYYVASSRASQCEILKLDIESENTEHAESLAVKVLKSLKKQGKVDVYIATKDIVGDSKEAEYLKNKYPDILTYTEKERSIIVKL